MENESREGLGVIEANVSNGMSSRFFIETVSTIRA
jgi:hypothetical protein